MQSNDMAFEKRERENNIEIETSNLLERILALKRVIKNKGSHGVDGMRCDELRTDLIEHWVIIGGLNYFKEVV